MTQLCKCSVPWFPSFPPSQLSNDIETASLSAGDLTLLAAPLGPHVRRNCPTVAWRWKMAAISNHHQGTQTSTNYKRQQRTGKLQAVGEGGWLGL
ncbi:hypothetical protein CDAR_111841 [Caerostris darwini]|uniref:Uncharacterized protein n=1 Tax=Caerostris darwini TaxID=1538125 RepID=A0AAV4R7I2_9ARAC|nr:hypothetical protein CDAR_111841 [Caerostris darwini]